LDGSDSPAELVAIKVVLELVDIVRQPAKELAGELDALRFGELFRKLEYFGQAIRRHSWIMRAVCGSVELQQWAVAQWLDRKVGGRARARVKHAPARAVAALLRDTERASDASLVERLGLPTAMQGRAALSELRASLWSAAA
jgi:hypothetical protein